MRKVLREGRKRGEDGEKGNSGIQLGKKKEKTQTPNPPQIPDSKLVLISLKDIVLLILLLFAYLKSSFLLFSLDMSFHIYQTLML